MTKTAKMNANRMHKADQIGWLQKAFGDATEIVVVTRQTGLTVAQVTDLRRKVRATGATYKVAKNHLTKIALKGTRFEAIATLLKGPTAIATAKDPVAVTKALVDFAKGNEKLTVIGGFFSGQVLDEAAIKTLASLPSLNELRAKIVGLLVAPAAKIARVIQAPPAQLARVLAARGRQEA